MSRLLTCSERTYVKMGLEMRILIIKQNIHPSLHDRMKANAPINRPVLCWKSLKIHGYRPKTFTFRNFLFIKSIDLT